jgi:predicted DNA repair protein MutK
VALIVRMDDAGYRLIRRAGNQGLLSGLGLVLVKALPLVIKLLAVVGTLALVLVSGGIFTHHIAYLHHLAPDLPSWVRELAAGLLAGLISVGVLTAGRRLWKLV